MHGVQSLQEPSARQAGDDVVTQAVARARLCLLGLQKPDGHWVGELQGDTILESEWALLMAFLGREKEDRVRKAANYILSQQQADGGWSNYPGGPPDVSVSTKAYFALKLVGHPADAPHMAKARAVIRALGGAAACNSFTKFYLALLGQFPYVNCASVPPEMVLLPRWSYINLYEMSSWTRTIVVPLAIFSAYRPVRQLSAELGIAELFLQPPETPLWPCPPAPRFFSWHNFFLGADWFYKKLERFGLLRPFRGWALRKAKAWMFERFADSDGLGAIFPPMIYTVISLKCLGYADDAPELLWALKQLDDLMIEEGDTLRLQPCFSPVWDTALTLIALADSGILPEHPALAKAARWLLDKEVRRPGDWSLANPKLEPAGWFFEYRNGFYPDTDDTAMVLMALARIQGSGVRSQESEGNRISFTRVSWPEREPERLDSPGASPTRAALERGVRWLLAMQNSDGGWAAFDRDINHEVLTKVPFADHNAMLDPSCPDITARVLESLAHVGYRPGRTEVDRGLAFIRRTQEKNGSWPGRWGVNYLYGTWQVLQGLARIGLDRQDPMVRRAADWLKSVQQVNGGWGESCRSYDDPAWAGRGEVTASQTAWALLGLIAAGEAGGPEVRRGVEYLASTQRSDGNWDEAPFTGTGFPKVFYLKYHMYSLYFPLMALARHRAASKESPCVSR